MQKELQFSHSLIERNVCGWSILLFCYVMQDIVVTEVGVTSLCVLKILEMLKGSDKT